MENIGVNLRMVKKDKDMTAYAESMKKIVKAKYKRSLWDRFKDAVGVFFFATILLISAISILGILVFLIITLIENPVSLAIICGTILLIWIWGNR